MEKDNKRVRNGEDCVHVVTEEILLKEDTENRIEMMKQWCSSA